MRKECCLGKKGQFYLYAFYTGLQAATRKAVADAVWKANNPRQPRQKAVEDTVWKGRHQTERKQKKRNTNLSEHP